MLDICKITFSNNNNNNGGKSSSILMDKIKSNYVDKSSHLNVIDKDNICLTNLIQLILTLIACLLMLFTGLYQFFKIKKFFLRYIHHNENHDHNNDNTIDHDYDSTEVNDSIQKNTSNIIGDNNKDNINFKRSSTNNNNSTYSFNSNNNNSNDNYSTSSSNTTTTINTDHNQILFKFHNIRCTLELLLLAINSLELCRSLLPLPLYSVTFWSDKITTSTPIAATTTTAPTSIVFDKNIDNPEYVTIKSTVSSMFINNDNNFDKFQLILYSPPFLIYNSILTIFTTLILIGYHRISESRNISELLYLSLSMETILGIVRFYQIHTNVPSNFDLEPFLNWSTGFCLFVLATIDVYVVYKQRFKSKRVSKKLNDDRLIGYKHSISTFFSKILFWWLTPFLWHGYREPLEQEDLGNLREEDSARAYYDRFLLIYKTTAKQNKNPSLWLCYLKSSWKWFTLGGILKLFGDLSALIGPLSIHQIVDYIEYEYNRSYLNNTSILYNIQSHFDGKQSVNFNSNNNNNNNNSNFGNNARMNLFNRNNLNTIWSLLRAHSISNRHHNINGIIQSHVDNIATTTDTFNTENTTKMSILNSTGINDDSNDNSNIVETNKLNGIFNQIIDTTSNISNSSNNESLSSFILPSSSSIFINRNLEYGEDIIRPIFSMVNSISDFFQIPSMTGINLWANISWVSDKQEQQQQMINLNSMNSIPGLFTNYYNQSDGNIESNFNNQYYTTQYLYYYYPNWSEFLSNGWIIAWIVLISAIAQGGLSQASTHLLNMTGIRIKTSLQGLIYRKTLLLSSSCIEINANLNGISSNSSGIEVNNSSSISQQYQQKKKKNINAMNDENKNIDNNCDNNSKRKLSNDSDNESMNMSENNMGAGNNSRQGLNSNTKRDAGSITNLMTEDSLNVMSFFWIAHYVWAIPLKIGLVMYLLYLKLGISAIIGSFVCILTMTPLQFLIGKAMSENSEISAQCTDERLRKINDIFLGIKLIKLNAWENVYKDKIATVRKKELKYLNKDSFYWTVMTFLTHLSSVLITFVTLAVYVKLETNMNSNADKTTSEKQSMFDSIGFEFTASRLFSALALFNQLTVPLLIFPITVPIIISATISTKRLERFLREPEVQREFEGIKNMARILSKSDAALDMYEIKIPVQEIKNPNMTNLSFSPITEIETSFEFPLTQDSLDSDVMANNTNVSEQNINNNNDDICKKELENQSSLKFDTNSQQKYYAEIIDNIEQRRNSGKWDDPKLYCQYNIEPRKSTCDEIDEFDKEYNETDDFYMEHKPLTQSKILNNSQVPSLPTTTTVSTIQQYFNVNNNNNKSNKNINNYNNVPHSNDYSNNNKNKNYNCYDEKNNDATIKDKFFRTRNVEKPQKGKNEIKKQQKEKQNIQTKENETIQNTDSPRISINTKLKREYKSNTLPKKRRNKDLIRGGGGGCGAGSGGTKYSHQHHDNGDAQNNTIDNLNCDKVILRSKNVVTNPLKSISNSKNHEITTGVETEEIDIDSLKKTTVRNSRKLVSGRESFQFQLADNISVSISNGIFSWDNCNVSLKIDELNIPRGKLTIVVGKNGSGKTSLIAAFLKEMHQISGDVSWNKYSTIAYVPQIPWLLNASIRDNILFGESFRPKRYEKVLEACALKPDIDLMPDGDMTLIGERGINLSGGQKQRINIARSLYSSANVVMMDDPLSSLDNEVAKHVFENSIKKMLLKANRTVILVTQKLQLLSSANYIIVMKDCCVQSAGNYEQIQKEHPDIVKEWNSIIAKGYEMDQISPNKTARERWRLFKNISRIGLLRPQDTEQEHLLSNQSLYMQQTTKRRSSIFGSRHLIYDIPLPIDECQNDDIIIKRRGSKRSILLMGLGNTISGTNMTNCELRQHNNGINCNSNNSSRIGRKNSVIRVKSLQPEVKNYANRTPVVRNISSPGRFLDTKARTSDSEFKQKNGFRQFLSRMSSRKSNLGTKLHRPISASASIQSISEESHQNVQRVESSCSSEILDDESVQDLNENTSPTTDEERKYGEIPLQIYMLYLKSCGLPIVLTFFITALIWQCLRVYTDVWLRYWTEMDSGKIQESITETLASAFNLNRDINTSNNNNNNNSFNSYQNNYNSDDRIEFNSGTRIFTEYDKQNQQNQQQQYDVTYCFNMYSIISSICILMSIISIPAGQKAGCNAREKLHDELLESLLAKPLHFFQVTPLGKIINRFSNDMSIIDKKIAPTSQRLLQFTLLCLCAVLINLAITPWFIVLTIPICFAYYIIQKFYRCSSRELQRLENITNSPVISHFNETIQGVTTIRAYSQESRFTETLFKRLEANTIAFVMLNTSNRWLGIALDYLGGVIVFIAIVTALLAASIAKGQQKLYNEVNSNFDSHDVRYNDNNGININFGSYNSSKTHNNIYIKNEESLSILSSQLLSPSPSLVGLAINYTLLVPIYLNWVVKLLSDMEMYVGSVERVAYYQQKLYETFNLWKNDYSKKDENHDDQSNMIDDENGENQQHEYHHNCNCKEKHDEKLLYCEKRNSNSENLVLSCTECSKITEKKEKENKKISTVYKTLTCCCSGCCCCNESKVTRTHHELKDVIYNTVPISWPQKGDIEFENVTLRHQGQQQNVITDLSLKIPAGQKIGICGRTGSGKSSLALSLFSVMEIMNGKILIDGININSIHPDEVRSRLSIIPQDVHLFNATIRENLDPRGHYSDLELWNCLELAQLKEIVTRMPHGLDAEIIEGGFNLSAGQRQLFCLARAVLRGSVCLVLDEATSSLDAITETALMDAAHNAFKGRTILTIAHRLSTLHNYDRIIVLDNGKIIEDGSPNELKAIPNGKFLTMLQSDH